MVRFHQTIQQVLSTGHALLTGAYVMRKRRTKTQGMKMPARLKAILGPPALLRYEDPRAYYALMDDLAAVYAPTDTVGWLWVKSAVDAFWDIRRYCPWKAAAIDSQIKAKLNSMLTVPNVPQATTTYEVTQHDISYIPEEFRPHTISKTYTISEEKLNELREKRENIIQERQASPYFADEPRDYTAIYAEAFIDNIDNIAKIEARVASAERRLYAALAELEQYRARRAASRPTTSPKVIDGDFEDVSAATAPQKLKKSA
jgi:hypothetical protein